MMPESNPHNQYPVTAYKIVEVVNDEIRTLYHGLHGTRTMPIGTWLRADMKAVKDGTSKTEYTSGWHVFEYKADAQKYLEKFSTRTDLLKIVECEVTGEKWEKVHSPSPVFLAEWIRFQ